MSYYLRYKFRSCREAKLNKSSSVNRERDRSLVTRFDCNSKLCITLSLDDETLTVVTYYTYHNPHEEIRMNSDVLSFLNACVAFQTSSKTHHNIQTTGLPQIDNADQHQVYYQWQKENERYWRRDNDAFISRNSLLEELWDKYDLPSTYFLNPFEQVLVCGLNFQVPILATASLILTSTKIFYHLTKIVLHFLVF